MRWSDPEFRRFLLAGLFNTGLGYLLYLAFNAVADYRVAYTLSYCVGILVAYAVSTLFVFKRPWRWRSLLAFPSVYAIQYLAGLARIWVLVGQFGLPEAWAPLVILPATIPLTFAISRFIIKGRTHDPVPR